MSMTYETQCHIGIAFPVLVCLHSDRQWIEMTEEQNRESTEGYSKSIVRKNNDKFGIRIGLNK